MSGPAGSFWNCKVRCFPPVHMYLGCVPIRRLDSFESQFLGQIHHNSLTRTDPFQWILHGLPRNANTLILQNRCMLCSPRYPIIIARRLLKIAGNGTSRRSFWSNVRKYNSTAVCKADFCIQVPKKTNGIHVGTCSSSSNTFPRFFLSCFKIRNTIGCRCYFRVFVLDCSSAERTWSASSAECSRAFAAWVGFVGWLHPGVCLCDGWLELTLSYHSASQWMR